MSQVFFTSVSSTVDLALVVLNLSLSENNTRFCKQHNVCLCFSVFFVFCRYIIGKKGETRKRLEFDTKTSINIPKQGVEGQIGGD